MAQRDMGRIVPEPFLTRRVRFSHATKRNGHVRAFMSFSSLDVFFCMTDGAAEAAIPAPKPMTVTAYMRSEIAVVSPVDDLPNLWEEAHHEQTDARYLPGKFGGSGSAVFSVIDAPSTCNRAGHSGAIRTGMDLAAGVLLSSANCQSGINSLHSG
jgi:hypothetical protein